MVIVYAIDIKLEDRVGDILREDGLTRYLIEEEQKLRSLQGMKPRAGFKRKTFDNESGKVTSSEAGQQQGK